MICKLYVISPGNIRWSYISFKYATATDSYQCLKRKEAQNEKFIQHFCLLTAIGMILHAGLSFNVYSTILSYSSNVVFSKHPILTRYSRKSRFEGPSTWFLWTDKYISIMSLRVINCQSSAPTKRIILLPNKRMMLDLQFFNWNCICSGD